MKIWRFPLLVSAAGALLLVLVASAVAQEALPLEPETPEDWLDLVPNPRTPLPGVLSGGQPTPEQLAAAREAGFATVINLRAPGEPGTDTEAGIVEELGMTYVSLPVEGTTGMTEENARALAGVLERAEQPVLLHCGSGNRIGGLFALMAYFLDDRSVDEALAVGLEAGLTRLEPAVREKLEKADAQRP